LRRVGLANVVETGRPTLDEPTDLIEIAYVPFAVQYMLADELRVQLHNPGLICRLVRRTPIEGRVED